MDSNQLPLAKVMDLLLDAICVVDRDGRFAFVSAAFERILGYAPSEVIGTPMIDLVYPPDRERTLQVADKVVAGEFLPHFENRYLRKDGQIAYMMWSARWSEQDQSRIAVGRDITELKRAQFMQVALFDISQAANVAEDIPALCLRVHQVIGSLLPANNFFVAMHDAARDEISFPYFVDEHDQPPAPRPLDSGTLSGHVISTGESLLLTPDSDAALHERVSTVIGMDSLDWLGVPLRSSSAVIGALVVQSYSGRVRYTAQDKALLEFVSTQVASAIERKQNEVALQHLAQHDPLTGLPNRSLALRRLMAALAAGEPAPRPVAVLFIDLDDFKQVNDSLGHPAGDLVLQQAAARMQACVRESDTVGRMGGDEFMVLLHHVQQARHASMVAEEIRAALSAPFEWDGRPLCISASIGVALFPEHGQDARTLVDRADHAMYAAKNAGGNRVLVAESALGSRLGSDPLEPAATFV